MIRQLASRGLSIEEIAPSPGKTKKAIERQLNGFYCRTMFLRVQREDNGSRKVPRCQQRICCFCLFSGREKENMETFAPKGNIRGPILPQFVLQMSITFGAKTMYAILCDYAADKDHCWPSQTTLAKRLSCSISSVKNYLAELVREKLISIKREQYRSSVYYLWGCPS